MERIRESVSEHVYWRTAAFAIERKIVAAIDLGTCNTKMAFAFNPLTHGGDVHVVVMDAWENAPGAVMAPTTLLIDHTGQVAAFGYEAEEKFRVLDVAKAKVSYLFKNFKMALHQKESFSEQHKISAINGGEMSAIQVFSLALKYLVDKLMRFISDTTGLSVIHPSSIQWVLTVPAIWKPGARQFMRKAAYKAGICDPSTRKQLIIALEPECAALYVRSHQDKHGAFRSLQYGVVDCGGGTIDIAYHGIEHREDSKFVVNELAPPSGGPYGGIRVDDAFEMLLEPVFGRDLNQPFFEQLKMKHPAAWLNFRRQLDDRKTVLDKKEDHDAVWFDITMQFSRACTHITGRDAFCLLSDSCVDGVTLSASDQMQVRADLIKALYCSSVDAICKCLNEDLARSTLSKVSALYMVGSFSKSNYLLESVRKKTHGSVPPEHIINPPDSSVAIVKGAVMYGINPSIIQERVAARSYGMSILREFNSATHPASKAVYHDNIKWCEGIYDEFLKRGDRVSNSGEPIKRRHVPVMPDQTNMLVQVYSAPHTVTYVDDEGSRHVASIVVDMPDLTGGRNRIVFIEIEFDGPEIHVVARDENTGKCYDASLDFIYDK